MKQQPAFWQPEHEQQAAWAKMRKKRREKILDANDIRLLMLYFLARQAAHGYELIKSVEDLSKGEYSPSPGIIYPNLTLLEEMDAIRVLDAQASRKAYTLNNKGREMLAANKDYLSVIIQRLSSRATLVNNRSIPEVEQAIHQIKTALNNRLSQQDIPPQTLQAIIAAMNDAAEKISRS